MKPDSDDEFVMIQDDSCHWYVIPADKRREAYSYLEAVNHYWEGHGEYPEQPEWFDSVGGAPSLVKFKSYRIGD